LLTIEGNAGTVASGLKSWCRTTAKAGLLQEVKVWYLLDPETKTAVIQIICHIIPFAKEVSDC